MADTTRTKVDVVGLVGSLRPGSHTRQAVQTALQGARALGADTELLDLSTFDLPACDGHLEGEPPAGVVRFRERLRAAHGFVVGTPEYHGSFSGLLKNALDLTGFEEFEGKVVGLVAVSGGALGGSPALAALRPVFRALHAWVIPDEGGIPKADAAFGPDGKPTDPRLTKRLEGVGREVARFAFMRHSQQVKDFVLAWETAAPNPGGPDR
jgi:NAD(P)H-dependent FMN reductase